MGQVELSFVVPAYNEEVFIEDTLCAIETLVKDERVQYEIVVVDDGSKDETFSKAFRYAQGIGRHVKVIGYPKNLGKGHAIKTGFMQATGDIVIFIDGDMEIDPKMISLYIDALKDADIAIATKWHPESEVTMALDRKIMSHSFNILFRILMGVNLKDTQVGLKAMRKSSFNNIFPRLAVKRFAFDVELLVVANLYRLKIVELPVRMQLSSSFSAKEIWRMFVDLLGITYRLRVIRWYQKQLIIKTK